MSLKTCQAQYEQAKLRDDKEGMKFWTERAKVHGGSIKEEEKPVRQPLEKEKK